MPFPVGFQSLTLLYLLRSTQMLSQGRQEDAVLNPYLVFASSVISGEVSLLWDLSFPICQMGTTALSFKANLKVG